jgi:hypothetical protein
MSAKAFRVRRRERYRKYRQRPEVSAYHRRKATEWRIKNHEKVLAHRVVTKALKEGRLMPTDCWACDSPDDIVAHHENYALPLAVVWLCRSCHWAVHHGTLAVHK